MHGLAVYVKEGLPFAVNLSIENSTFSIGFTSLTNVFVFWDYNVHQKDRLTYSGGNGRPDDLCCNFSISNELTQIVNFPTQIPDCEVLLFWIYLFLLTLVFVLQWLSLLWGILIILLYQSPLAFQ